MVISNNEKPFTPLQIIVIDQIHNIKICLEMSKWPNCIQSAQLQSTSMLKCKCGQLE